jgi:nucleotide-binding universal stress UspA family protein
MSKSFYKKIIVAINGSQSSIHAAMYAIMMAKSYNLALKVVYVVDTATIKYLTMNKFFITEEKEEFEKKLKIDGEHYLNSIEMLSVSKGIKIEKELRCGGIFNEILKVSEEFNSDLIILGGNESKSSKNDVHRFVLSSDKNEILSNSKCPVLIMQKQNIEEEFKIF